MQVPCGLQGKMRGTSLSSLGKDKTYYWFCWDVLACVWPAMCHPWLEPYAPLCPHATDGACRTLGLHAGTGCASALVCRGHC